MVRRQYSKQSCISKYASTCTTTKYEVNSYFFNCSKQSTFQYNIANFKVFDLFILIIYYRTKTKRTTRQKQIPFHQNLARLQFKPALHQLYSFVHEVYFSMFESILPCIIIRTRLLWIILLGGSAAAAAVVVFYLPGLRLPDKEEFQLFKPNHFFER